MIRATKLQRSLQVDCFRSSFRFSHVQRTQQRGSGAASVAFRSRKLEIAMYSFEGCTSSTNYWYSSNTFVMTYHHDSSPYLLLKEAEFSGNEVRALHR